MQTLMKMMSIVDDILPTVNWRSPEGASALIQIQKLVSQVVVTPPCLTQPVDGFKLGWWKDKIVWVLYRKNYSLLLTQMLDKQGQPEWACCQVFPGEPSPTEAVAGLVRNQVLVERLELLPSGFDQVSGFKPLISLGAFRIEAANLGDYRCFRTVLVEHGQDIQELVRTWVESKNADLALPKLR